MVLERMKVDGFQNKMTMQYEDALRFGAEGKISENTLLSDEPLEVSGERYSQLKKVVG